MCPQRATACLVGPSTLGRPARLNSVSARSTGPPVATNSGHMLLRPKTRLCLAPAARTLGLDRSPSPERSRRAVLDKSPSPKRSRRVHQPENSPSSSQSFSPHPISNRNGRRLEIAVTPCNKRRKDFLIKAQMHAAAQHSAVPATRILAARTHATGQCGDRLLADALRRAASRLALSPLGPLQHPSRKLNPVPPTRPARPRIMLRYFFSISPLRHLGSLITASYKGQSIDEEFL
jgi:hypothetical protein